jgi:peptidoglycan/LPS O-acetylase OafA/YrhL
MRFRILDGWRGIAALFVALYRFEADGALFHLHLVRNAGLFVDFFFVLSGFVIAHAYLDRLRDGRSFTHFVIRRFGRLWPLHVVMFLPFLAFELIRLRYGVEGGSGGPAFSGYRAPGTIPVELAFLSSLGIYPTTGWNTPSWSISSEFWTYLLFGFFCIVARRWMIVVAACTALIGLALVRRYANDLDVTFWLGTLRCFGGFFAGVIVNLLWRRAAPRREALARTLGWCEAPVVILAFAFVALAGGWALSFAAPVVFGCLVFVFAAEAGVVSRAMRTRPFLLLGDLSYSIYMTALLIALVVGRAIVTIARRAGFDIAHTTPVSGETFEVFGFSAPLVNDALAIVYLAIVIVVSYLTWRLIEKPGRRIFNRLADRFAGAA